MAALTCSVVAEPAPVTLLEIATTYDTADIALGEFQLPVIEVVRHRNAQHDIEVVDEDAESLRLDINEPGPALVSAELTLQDELEVDSQAHERLELLHVVFPPHRDREDGA